MRAKEFILEELDSHRLERLDPQTRRVLQRMADHAEPGSWLSAEEAYAMQLGLKNKTRDLRGWEQEIQRFVDLYNQHHQQLEEDWRKWVAGGAMAAAALSPMAAQAQAYQQPVNVPAAMQTLRKDDYRVQQNQSTQDLARVIYAQMVKERGQPMDARQQQKWMTIAQEKAAAQIQKQQQQPQQQQQQQKSGQQGSEYRKSPMMGKDW